MKIDALKQNVCSLESTVSAQEKVVKSMESAAHVIDVEKYSKHIKTFEELIENIAKKQVEQIKESRTEMTKHYVDLLQVFVKNLIYAHPKHRRQLIDGIQYQLVKASLLTAIEQIEDMWIAPPDSELSFALGLEGALKKQNKGSE